MKRKGYWTCQRVSLGAKCGHANPNRKRICEWCKKPRPARKRPAHMSALDLPYSYYAALNGGETCGICGRAPAPGRRLDRDHCHKGVGTPRGLLCVRCNKHLHSWMEPAWLRAAADYLERADSRGLVSVPVGSFGAQAIQSPAQAKFCPRTASTAGGVARTQLGGPLHRDDTQREASA